MKLDQFPTNDTARKMMDMVTGDGFYERSYVGKWLFQIMGAEMEDARGLFEELREQIFPETATWGIIYHEDKYGIPRNDQLSLEERRERVIQKRDIRAPINPARLEQIITTHTGRPSEVTDYLEPYVFGVFIDFLEATPVSVLKGMYARINRLKPSHLSYDVTARIETVSFQNQNYADLYSVLFDMRFYSNNVSSFEQVQYFLHHFYQGDQKHQLQASYRLPTNRQDGNHHTWYARINHDYKQSGNMNADQFITNAAATYGISAKLVKDGMFTFDGEWIFDGTRRFNANIIEEVL